MAGSNDARCAVLSQALGEPLAGTATVGDRLVCLEHPTPWPRDVRQHPDPAIAAFARRAGEAGRTLMLIRRHGRNNRVGAPRTLLVVDLVPGATRVRRHMAHSLDELSCVPLEGECRGGAVHHPLILVCTHGVRDRCCAVDGRALAAGITKADADQQWTGVWECSHLGGHRFAPTALVLPTGYVYGRLDVDTALQARKAAGQGEVLLRNCRGQAGLPAAAQVAELALREHTGLLDVDAVRVERIEPAGRAVLARPEGAVRSEDSARAASPAGPVQPAEVRGGATVTLRTADGSSWVVAVEQVEGPCRPPSCGALLERATPLHAQSITRVVPVAR